jgi:hypothetical protein
MGTSGRLMERLVGRLHETPILKSLQSTPGVQVHKIHLRRISTAWLFLRRLLPLLRVFVEVAAPASGVCFVRGAFHASAVFGKEVTPLHEVRDQAKQPSSALFRGTVRLWLDTSLEPDVFSGYVGEGQAADIVGDEYGIIGVGNAVVLDSEHEARVGSEVGVIDKVEVQNPAGSVAVVVLLQGHEEGDLRRQKLEGELG